MYVILVWFVAAILWLMAVVEMAQYRGWLKRFPLSVKHGFFDDFFSYLIMSVLLVVALLF